MRGRKRKEASIPTVNPVPAAASTDTTPAAAQGGATRDIVAQLWGLCNVLRDDGITYHLYVTELTYLLFLKMMQETRREEALPQGWRWGDLMAREGEALLEKNAAEKKSGAGQCFTPRPLIDCMVRLLQPKAGEVIQDPAAGTGASWCRPTATSSRRRTTCSTCRRRRSTSSATTPSTAWSWCRTRIGCATCPH